MDQNFIVPMVSWSLGTGGITTGDNRVISAPYAGSGSTLFQDIFNNVADQVKTTQADVENKQYLLATGQLQDAHSLPIAEAKAAISLDLMISLRNKALEGYNELMRITV